jgi:N-acyl-D-amino-acid deacylase
MFDILIRGGRVYDGTGAPWFHAGVAVQGGKIAAIGPIAASEARRVIDAGGLAVSPGFIDIHSHSDTVFLANPKADSKVRQGVTLEVAGNCGSSVAPVTEKSLERTQQNTRGEAEVTWRTMGEYFDALDRSGVTTNVACLVGHGQVRTGVMEYDRRPPTAAELDAMKKLVAQAMDDGAVGISSGLIYPPSSYAETDELVELAGVVAAKHGLYFTHMRNENVELLKSVAEATEVGEKAGLPVQIAHHKASGQKAWGLVKQSLAMIDEARMRGVDVTADQYPYIASSTGLTSIIPGWAHEGGRPAILARLKDAETRSRLKIEVTVGRGDTWEKLIVSKVTTEKNKRFEGKSVAEIAAILGKEPCDAAFDLLIEEDCEVGQISFGMCEEDVMTVMRHPFIMPGSDGSSLADHGVLGEGKPHPRNYGTFARVLGKYVREEHNLRLEEAIRKMTSLPAWRLGLWDRGILRPGNCADITIFDPATVKDVSDFPDPHRYAAGIPYVLVNGQVVVEHGSRTDAVAGKVLRMRK